VTSPETTREAGDTEARLLSIIGMNYAILVAGGKRIADHSKAAQIIAAEIDALDDKLYETNVERLGYKEAYDEQAAAHIQTRRELADARAEIARLTAEVAAIRPAADAYRACVRWENASSYGTADECTSAWTEYLAATRRAIAFIAGAAA